MLKTLLRDATPAGLACAALMIVAGCSGSGGARPADSLSDAELAVTRAEQARVGDYDAVDLRHARENLTAARATLSGPDAEKDKSRVEKARWLASRAKIDAELGLARAEVSRLTAQTRAIQRELDEHATPAAPATGS